MIHLAGVAANPRPAGHDPHAQVETNMHESLTERAEHIRRDVASLDDQGRTGGVET